MGPQAVARPRPACNERAIRCRLHSRVAAPAHLQRPIESRQLVGGDRHRSRRVRGMPGRRAAFWVAGRRPQPGSVFSRRALFVGPSVAVPPESAPVRCESGDGWRTGSRAFLDQRWSPSANLSAGSAEEPFCSTACRMGAQWAAGGGARPPRKPGPAPPRSGSAGCGRSRCRTLTAQTPCRGG